MEIAQAIEWHSSMKGDRFDVLMMYQADGLHILDQLPEPTLLLLGTFVAGEWLLLLKQPLVFSARSIISRGQHLTYHEFFLPQCILTSHNESQPNPCILTSYASCL